jgi:HK97 family phage portal protein
VAITAKLKSWFPFTLFTNPERGIQEGEPRVRTSEADIIVTDERSLQVPVVLSALRLIAETVGMLPLHVYRRVANGRERDDSHPAARVIEDPNPLMTRQEYLETTALQIAGWGNSYSRIDRNSEGTPTFLWPLIPSRMQTRREGYSGITYIYSHDDTQQTDYRQEKILHYKGFGSDGVVGLSPLGYARQALGITIAAEMYAASFYKNGGRASSIFSLDKPLQHEQRNKFQEYMNEISRSQGAGLWVLPVPGKWQDITIPPEDAQMLLTRQFQVAEIARIFRIPLFLLMEMEKSTSWGTGLEQQNLGFLTHTVAPYLKRIESVMNRRLLNDDDRKTHYVEFNVDGLLRTDAKTRGEFYSSMVQNGLMNRNEVRAKENMEPYPAGAEFTAQTNLAPVDKLGQIADDDSAVTRLAREEEGE